MNTIFGHPGKAPFLYTNFVLNSKNAISDFLNSARQTVLWNREYITPFCSMCHLFWDQEHQWQLWLSALPLLSTKSIFNRAGIIFSFDQRVDLKHWFVYQWNAMLPTFKQDWVHPKNNLYLFVFAFILTKIESKWMKLKIRIVYDIKLPLF